MADYTDRELAEAEDFLRRRVESEVSMQRDVDTLLSEYAGYILMLLYREAPIGDINAIVDELIERLIDDCYILGVDENDDIRDDIMFFMNTKRNGATMEELVRQRVSTFFLELSSVYVAAKLLGYAQKEVLASIRENFKHPWSNPILKEIRKKIKKGEVAADKEMFEKAHYGQGREISSHGALTKITTFYVADAWMWWQNRRAVENGAKGYFVLRGSSYDCPICDSHTGIFYPLTDSENRPLYHLNCKCIVVYSYVDRL